MLTVAAVLAIFVYGIIAAMLGTILPDISKRFNLSPKQNGNIAMAQAIGLMIGGFSVGPLTDIEADPPAAVLPLAAAMRDLERVDVDDEQARAVSHGMSFAASALSVQSDGPYALVDRTGALLAVYDTRGAALRPAVVVVRMKCCSPSRDVVPSSMAKPSSRSISP